MTSEHWTDRLSEYIDGEMVEGDREALELHLLECASCAELLGELREIVGAAGALEDREPASDLWPGIAHQLAARTAAGEAGADDAAEQLSVDRWRRPRSGGRRGALDARRVSLTVPQLLAAGIALVLFSAGGAWVALSPGPDVGAPTAAVAPTASADVDPASPLAFAAAYESAITELETAYREQRQRLDPETIQVVERNLAIIDAAIGDARRALEEDPASGFLNTHLANAMRRKVDLLRQAARIDRTET